MKIFGCYFLFLFLSPAAFAQLVEYPIGSHNSLQKKSGINSRTQAVTLGLPFWDDFSYSDSRTYPREDLWQLGQSVFLNNGLGINQPSKNVVTFDGVDSVGKPYNVNDILAKGYADRLVSLPIPMGLDSVSLAERSTVYFSFFYQVKGNGESPDNGDLLVLLFKNSSKVWVPVYTIENSTSIQPDVFYQVIFPVSDTSYFHKDFQFRFQNFARLSGPYDTWNLDYVYLNKNRNATDTSFPDRTVSSSLTSLFVDYFSMPVKHFLQNPAANLKHPSLDLYNVQAPPPNVGQPFNYTTEARIATKIGPSTTSVTIPLDVAEAPPGPILDLPRQQFYHLTLKTIPSPADFNPLAESIQINLKYGMNTKDNLVVGGDYDPVKYSPMDFRSNDTIRTNYVLDSYYAYDDGVAEYGAGINQAGSYLAIKYLMKSAVPDTLVYIDIYFPQYGDNTNRSIQLQVRRDLSDTPASILYQQNVQVTRTTQNKFTRYKLEPAVVVSGDFYIGWKILVQGSLPVGFDKNNDQGDKLYYNSNGAWVQNVSLRGSLMVHPGFGEPNAGVVTGVENIAIYPPVYPNPTTRTCYLPAQAEHVVVFDVTGRPLETEINQLLDKKSLTFLSSFSGMAIVRYFLNGKLHAEKIMVQAE